MSLREKVELVLSDQSLGILGTSSDDMPHTTLVAFAANLERKEVCFVTGISSRKARNIDYNPNVCLFIDNRRNEVKDFRDTLGITIKGLAEVAGEFDTINFLKKHPHLVDFVDSPSTRLYRIIIKNVEVVTEFQKVYELILDE